MRLTGSTTLAFGIAAMLALLASLGASQAAKPPRGARVAVVAYHDSRLLTLCPVLGKDVIESKMLTSEMRARVAVNYPPNGGQLIAIKRIDEGGTFGRLFLPIPAGRPAPVGPGGPAPPPAAADLDRLARDPDVESRLIEQFRGRKTYVIADDPSEADFVFVAESAYSPLSGGTADSVTVNVLIMSGDRPANWRESILAIAVPGALYRGHAGDGSALSAARIWSGVAVSERTPDPTATDPKTPRTMKAASPEDLVDRFHARGAGLPDYLPVCAATDGTIRSFHGPAEAVVVPAGGAPPGGTAAGAAAPPKPPGAAPGAAGGIAAPRFRSNVTLVTVPATVTDRNGAIVPDLPVSSFHVFENDVEQKVDRLEAGALAADLALLIDSSASMRQPRESIRSSAEAFATALRAADRALVVKFASRVQVLSEPSRDRFALRAALAAPGPGGGTRLYDALALAAADRLIAMDGRKAVVLLTDGRDTQSQLTNEAGAMAALEAIDAPVYVIRYETPDASSFIPSGAYGIRRWLIPFSEPGAEDKARAAADAFLVRLVSGTGGQLYAAKADAQVPEMIADIADTLSNQLVLRYYPANDRLDGTYRRIRVAVDCDGCTVRARTGYRAGFPR